MRVSIRWTGAFACFESWHASIPSTPMPNFEPKPPPMCSTTALIALSFSPSSFAASPGMVNVPWVEA